MCLGLQGCGGNPRTAGTTPGCWPSSPSIAQIHSPCNLALPSTQSELRGPSCCPHQGVVKESHLLFQFWLVVNSRSYANNNKGKGDQTRPLPQPNRCWMHWLYDSYSTVANTVGTHPTLQTGSLKQLIPLLSNWQNGFIFFDVVRVF